MAGELSEEACPEQRQEFRMQCGTMLASATPVVRISEDQLQLPEIQIAQFSSFAHQLNGR